jgi:integrase
VNGRASSWVPNRRRFERIFLFPVITGDRLLPSELRSIYEAALKLGAPWSVMVGLTMITGEAIEDIRHLRDRDIDWKACTWTVEWRGTPSAFSSRLRIIALRAEALALLVPYRDTKGYFFQSPRSLLPRPINFYAEVIERLKDKSGVNSDWGIKDLR